MTGAVERLGWTLLHSLWEDALIWLVLQAALAALQRCSAQVRYFAGCAALAAAVLAPVTTYFCLAESQAHALATVSVDSPVPTIAVPGASLLGNSAVQRVQFDLALALPWLVSLWAAGCAFSTVRLSRDWRAADRLARVPYQPLPEAIQQRVRHLASQLGLDRLVRLGESASVTVPSVVGWLKPVILVPASAFAGLTSTQIDGLLAHELAHILRHDFAVNVLQACCEVLYFYHPAIHAINRTIRDERENACDDLAVAVVGDARGYAAALVELEVARQPALLVAATGHGALLPRLHRLVGLGNEPQSRPASARWGLLAGSVISLSVLILIASLVARLSGQAPSSGISDAQLPFAIAATLQPTGDFLPGDFISVAEVRGDRPQFEVGGTYLVQGTYTLASASRATLALSLTASSSLGGSRWNDEQFRTVKGGQGTFAFKTTIQTPGKLHVSFYLPDQGDNSPSRRSSSHGGIYLGTRH